MKTFPHLWPHLAECFLEWEMFKVEVVEKVKTFILCPITLFAENLAVYEMIQKNVVEPETPHSTWYMRVAYCISKATRAKARSPHAPTPTRTRTHTEVCNTHCFSTATVVSWTRHDVTLYVHCLYCWYSMWMVRRLIGNNALSCGRYKKSPPFYLIFCRTETGASGLTSILSLF